MFKVSAPPHPDPARNSRPNTSEVARKCPLPNELLNEIAFHACAASAITYASLVQVSITVRAVVELRCLTVVPVILSTPRTVAAFWRFLRSSPEAAQYVRHLWFSLGTEGTKAATNSIIRACANVVTLACEPRHLISICGSLIFKHAQLRELTLLRVPPDWNWLSQYSFTRQLFDQVTHLQMKNGIRMQIPAYGWFIHLESLVIISRGLGISVENAEAISSMPSLENLVLINKFCSEWEEDLNWRYATGGRPVDYSESRWDPVKLWCERVRGKPGIFGVHDDVILFEVRESYVEESAPIVESFRMVLNGWEERRLWFR